MIRRRARRGGMRGTATYSDCGLYRYALTREWGPGPRAAFVMLNPSTACALADDPTIARVTRRARTMGCGAVRVVNLYAFRATRPADLFRARDPVGPANARTLQRAASWADAIVCAWGAHGARDGRGAEVAASLRHVGSRLLHLGLTKGGEPRHPLYVAAVVKPAPWTSG